MYLISTDVGSDSAAASGVLSPLIFAIISSRVSFRSSSRVRWSAEKGADPPAAGAKASVVGLEEARRRNAKVEIFIVCNCFELKIACDVIGCCSSRRHKIMMDDDGGFEKDRDIHIVNFNKPVLFKDVIVIKIVL